MNGTLGHHRWNVDVHIPISILRNHAIHERRRNDPVRLIDGVQALLQLLASLPQSVLHLPLADDSHSAHGNMLHGLLALLDRTTFLVPGLDSLAGGNIFAEVDWVIFGFVAFPDGERPDRLGSRNECFLAA